jgi:hypothetical protein
MSQQWVSQQLLFGRFLGFTDLTTDVVTTDLTEGGFRQRWEGTDPALGEKDRFRAICQALGIEPPHDQVLPVVVKDNLDASILEFARRIKMVNVDKRRKYEIRGLLVNGAEHIQEMVLSGAVGLGSAHRFTRDKTLAQQADAKVHDVRGYSKHAREMRNAAPKQKATLEQRQIARNEAAIATALRRAAKPRLTPEEAGFPPPELRHQQYPGREPGVTYANVHREQHGPIWHNVSKRRQLTGALKLKEIAAELEKAFAEYFALLDTDGQAGVRKRWQIAAKRTQPLLDFAGMPCIDEEQAEIPPLTLSRN